MYSIGNQEASGLAYSPAFYARPLGSPWPTIPNEQMKMSGHQLVYYPVRTISPASHPNSGSMASHHKQSMYRPVQLNPSGGFCQCPRPCPVPLERYQLPLCNNCIGNQSHASPYVAIQPQVANANVSQTYHHLSAFHYQPGNYSVHEPRPSNAQPTMMTPVLNDNSKTTRETNVASDRPVASILGVSSSLRRTETTDQLQQYPSQVYIDGLLQPATSRDSNEHFASDKLSMEFVAHEPADEEVQVVQSEPEPLTNHSHGIHITANAHIRFHLSIPMFTPNVTNDGVTEEPLIGVSNIPGSLPVNLHARAPNQQSSVVTKKQEMVLIDSTRARNDNKISLATTNPVEHNSPSTLTVENIRRSSKNPANLHEHPGLRTSVTIKRGETEASVNESEMKVLHLAGQMVSSGNDEQVTTPPTESKLPRNPASTTSATPKDSFQVYPENWAPNSIADLAGVEEVTTITREVSLVLEQESDVLSLSFTPKMEMETEAGPPSQPSIPSRQSATVNSSEPTFEQEQTSTKVSILPEHLRRLLSHENRSLKEQSPTKQLSVSVIKAPEKQPNLQPSVSIFHSIRADSKTDDKMVTRASQAKSHHKTHSSPTVKKKFSSGRQNKGYSKSNSSAYKSKSKGSSKHHLRRSVKTFKSRRGKATEPGQGTHKHDPNALEMTHLASNNEYRQVRTTEHVEIADTVAAYESGTLLPNAPLSIIAPLHISVNTTQESLQIKPAPQAPVPSQQNHEPSKKSNVHGLPLCQTPSGHQNKPPCSEPPARRQLEEKGTSTERSRKTQTEKQKVHKPEVQKSESNADKEANKSSSHDRTQTAFILCPRRCPKLTTTTCRHDTKCGTWPVMDDKYFSTPLRPHSNDRFVKSYTKASLRGAQATATQKALVQQKRFPRREGTRQFDHCNSLNLCAPGPNGCYEEVEHWILEPELLTMSNHGSQSKVGNGNGLGFCNLPKLRNLSLIADADRTTGNGMECTGSECMFLFSQGFGRGRFHVGKNGRKAKRH